MAVLAVAALAAAALQAPAAFEVHVWRAAPEPEGAREVWARLGGVTVQRGEERAPFHEAGLAVGLFNAAGRDALHPTREAPGEAERWQRWYDTREPRYAVRAPCLSEPATREELAATLRRSLEGGDTARLSWVALGDEVALSAASAPGELCLGPACRAAWARYLAERRDLDADERAAYADPLTGDTDRARLALADGDLGALHPWLVRRAFQAALVDGALLELERVARQAAPDAALALLGVGAQSPFGTPRLERGWPELEVIEAYREVDARALALSLRGPDTRVLLTIFPDQRSATETSLDVWEHALAGGDGVVLWDDAALAGAPEHVARLERTLAGVGRLREALGRARLGPRGVALVHDFESLCLAWLRDALLDGPTWPRRFQSHQVAHGTWETNASGWLRLARDAGLQPGALPLERVGAATVEAYPVLVASELGVVEEDEARGLEAYLDAGGTLVVSGTLGRCDARGRSPTRPLLERLRERAPERVHAVEGRAADYLDERRLHTPRARQWRASAADWFAPADVPPFELSPASPDLPWIVAWTRTANGDVVGAALPGWSDVEGNAPLADLAVEVRPLGGLQVEWLHPPSDPDADGARLLPAGEACVFRLR